MKTKIIITTICLGSLLIGLLLANKSGNKTNEVVVSNKNKSQYLVLLDLSDRITKPGQIASDKEMIENVYAEFEKTVYKHLAMNSKDRFQVCIAPQKNLGFDKDIESDKLTLDLAQNKPAEKLKRLKDFGVRLKSRLDSLYCKADKGVDPKKYEGSNIWQFFNEMLADMTNDKTETKLVVITDGYFDFEKGNPEIKKGNLATTTAFISKIGRMQDWKSVIAKEGYGILPLNRKFENLAVCVAEIRSKNDNNLNETEILNFVWTSWLEKNRIDKAHYTTISHGPLTNSQLKLTSFLNSKLM